MKIGGRIYDKVVVVTGGAGFIGSNLLLRMVPKYPNYLFVNVDALTYAGNLTNLQAIERAENYIFEHVDITRLDDLFKLFDRYDPSYVIHFAAESHVDRSIVDPLTFVRTNVMGTVNLLFSALKSWEHKDMDKRRFYHVSTDEVYGMLEHGEDPFTEQHLYAPRSPYSASKASADHFVRAYYETYGLPVVISNCSNNYGPYQFPEKLIPLTILNIYNEKKIPIYGDGQQVRDWLYVTDHVDAIDEILHHGRVGETYNVGGDHEMTNIDLVRRIIVQVDAFLGRKEGHSLALITHVTDRPGHDVRYAIDASKIKGDLGWAPKLSFEEGLQKTIEWYLGNMDWLETIASGNYKDYYSMMYDHRKQLD